MDTVSGISGVLKTYEVYKSDERRQVQKAARADENKDTVAISGKAKDYQSARLALQSIPDVRGEIVSAVKKKYDANPNAVSSADIAEKLLSKI